MSKENLFESFTNLYSLSKTLRFELKPVGRTQKMLEEAHVFDKDETIKKKYEATKPYFDKLHREFVKEALKEAKLNPGNYLNIFREWKKDKKAKEKELQKKEKELREEVVKYFDKQGKEWAEKYQGLKSKNIEILFEEAVFKSILKQKYGDEKQTKIVDETTGKVVSIFDSWKGFKGYFDKFFETRKNFYKSDGTSTALATRIIDQNLKRFCDNILVFESLKGKIDFSEIEENFSKNLLEIFSLDFYRSCLLQDGIDFYNKILGGENLENGEKLKGLNEVINKYRQENKGEKTQFFKPLDKQILSEKEKFIDEIENDEEFLKSLKNFHDSSEKKVEILRNLFKNFLENKEYDFSQIYFSKEAFNTISRKWTFEVELFEEKLFEILSAKEIKEWYDLRRKDKNDPKIKKDKDEYKFPNFIKLQHVKEALEKISVEKFWKERYYKSDENQKGFLEMTNKENIWTQFLDIFSSEFYNLISLDLERNIEKEKDFQKILKNIKNSEEFISADEEKRIIKSRVGYDVFSGKLRNLFQDFYVNDDSKIIIKNFADSILTIYQMAKYFAVEKKRAWQTDYELDVFYTDPEKGYLNFYGNAYEEIVQVYNKIRNYLTKKPYSQGRWKLNFENPTLADGFDKNKEESNFAVILRKEDKYFLGLMTRGHNKIFDDRYAEKFQENIGDGKYEKMVYKLLPGANKMLPKVFFAASNIDFYSPSEKILEIRNHSTHTKNGSPQKGFDRRDFNLSDCHELIDFFKKSIAKHPDWKNFNFNFSDTEKYQDISDFYREVESGGYDISFQDISESYINEKNENGEIYLFQIKNKDWNEGSTGSKNLHTLYFESLFSPENMAQNFPMKLNGQAEIFYRPKTEEDKLGYRENEDGSTKTFIDKRDGNKEKNVIKNRRYNENKIFFHVPLTLNRTKGEAKYFNAEVNNFLANNPEVKIIGVDRGEKHLAYFSVINQKGEILESGSLNEIDGINYAEKLEEKAKNREQARKDWQTVEGIKDLKKGYISQVVRKLADLTVKHNAIIVFEDLNMRFKQIRGGIEKSVYQQLEKALIDKLSFLVDKKEKDPKQAGNLLKAYQLTAPFETFQKMGKQTGIMFYTQANYTSKIDPVTGWRPNLYLKNASAKTNKENVLKFDKIEFDKKNKRFEFTYDLKTFFPNQKEYPKKTKWTICSCVERFRWNRTLNGNKGGYVHYEDLTIEFVKLFSVALIDVSGNILEQIGKIDVAKKTKFFRDFIFYFGLLCQIRNTQKEKDGNDNDFIFSPVEPFFDSRKDNGENLPKNGDDNGAYNIARKGVVILDKISKFAEENESCDELKWGDLFVSHIDWDNFAQKQN